jgi:hypothetical protein
MPKLSDLLAEKAKGDVQVGGATVEFDFYVMWRERFTDDEWTKLLATPGRGHLKTLLPRVLVSWDIVDDDGHAIPVTADAIDQHNVPTVLMQAIAKRAVDSELSGKASSSNSPGS